MGYTKSRNYTRLTLKRLYGASGNQCAFPGCKVMFYNSENDSNDSEICHIEDANKSIDKKDRYNPNMDDKQRADYKNLILLCNHHHRETNNPDKYSVEDLKEMKLNHELLVLKRMKSQNHISKYPSILKEVVDLIGKQLIDNNLIEITIHSSDREKKIMITIYWIVNQ